MTKSPLRPLLSLVAILGASLVGTAHVAAHDPAPVKSAPTGLPPGAVAKGEAKTDTAAPKPTPLAALAIQVERLPNGLTVVMNPDRTVPTVAVAVYYNVGSRNEERGRTGFAHLFEHMMFEGSAHVKKGEHFQLVMNRGGSPNGTTSDDRTNYFQLLPANELALGLWLEADRMASLDITKENFENQRQTVMEERRQSYANQPYMLSMLRVNELAFGDYFPYAHSTIGDMKDLENAPLSAVQEFFHKYYTPSNAVLSIAGDFDPKDAMAYAQKYFGHIKSHAVAPFTDTEIQPQTAERTETMVDPLADLPAFHIQYHIPPNRDPDHYALEMLTLILGHGDSSRLYQDLVKKREVAQQVSVGTDDRRGPDLFSFWVILSPKANAEATRKLIYDQLAKIAKDGVTPRELEKAKNNVRSLFVFGVQSNMSRAQQLAEYQMYWGDAALLKEEPAKYDAVTNEDIKRVAQKYFAPTNRTVLDVVPASAAKEPAAKQPAAPATKESK